MGLALMLGAAPAARAETAYVANTGSSNVTPIDVATGTAGSPIPVAAGAGPRGIAIAPDGRTAFVPELFASSVTPIDLISGTTGADIPLTPNSGPEGIAVSPTGNKVYVAQGSGEVTPINAATDTAGTPIPIAYNPVGIAFAPDGATAYVASTASNVVTPIDVATDTAETPIPVAGGPIALAVTPDGRTLYVATQASDTLTPINLATRTVTTPIALGASPAFVAIAPNGVQAYVSVFLGNRIIPVNLAAGSVGAPITVGGDEEGVAFSPDGRTAYAVNTGANTITPITVSTGTAGPPIAVGASPWAVAFTPDQPPVAAFTDTVATPGTGTKFDASGSSGAPASYHWNFGDGLTTTTTTPTTTHVYTSAKTYTATLAVYDSIGCGPNVIYTGQTAYCSGAADAAVSHTLTIPATTVPTTTTTTPTRTTPTTTTPATTTTTTTTPATTTSPATTPAVATPTRSTPAGTSPGQPATSPQASTTTPLPTASRRSAHAGARPPVGPRTQRPGSAPSSHAKVSAGALRDPRRSLFAASLRRPNDLPLSLADIGRSVGLAILLLALLGLPARVFNATTKTHRREFQKWLATLRTRLPAVAPAAVRKLGGIAAVSAVIATGVHAFLNPGFPTRAGSGAFALGMLLGWAVIVLNCVVSWRVYVARYASHATGRWHVYTGQIGVSMLCVAVSRLGHFVPGLMLGMAGDYETYNRIELEHQARRIALTATTLAAVSLIAWGLSVPVGDAATHPNASFLTLTLDATVSVVAVAGMETLLFTLIPLQFLDGHVLMSWRPRLWLALWGGGALWFSLVVLNPALSHPEGTAHGATRVSVGWLASLLGAEMIIAMGLWTFFALRKRTAQRPASPA